MAQPVRARRLTDYEGQRPQQTVRRGKHDSIKVRRDLIIMASASGTAVPAIAGLVAAHEDTVRDVIHAFNERGWPPLTLGGRPAVPAGSAVTSSSTSSRRPPPDQASSGSPSPAAAWVTSSATWLRTPRTRCALHDLPCQQSSEIKVLMVMLLFAPTAFLALRSALAWLVMPTLTWRFLADNPYYWAPGCSTARC
jgi:hypothetical protein